MVCISVTKVQFAVRDIWQLVIDSSFAVAVSCAARSIFWLTSPTDLALIGQHGAHHDDGVVSRRFRYAHKEHMTHISMDWCEQLLCSRVRFLCSECTREYRAHVQLHSSSHAMSAISKSCATVLFVCLVFVSILLGLNMHRLHKHTSEKCVYIWCSIKTSDRQQSSEYIFEFHLHTEWMNLAERTFPNRAHTGRYIHYISAHQKNKVCQCSADDINIQTPTHTDVLTAITSSVGSEANEWVWTFQYLFWIKFVNKVNTVAGESTVSMCLWITVCLCERTA